MNRYHIINIDYDTDGYQVNLPTEMDVECEDEFQIADKISDRTGWLVNSFDIQDDYAIAYDRNGKEIHTGDRVIWTDPETKQETVYDVWDERPTEDMVKLANDYGECEALPGECQIIPKK